MKRLLLSWFVVGLLSQVALAAVIYRFQNVSVNGTLTATSFTGNGAALTSTVGVKSGSAFWANLASGTCPTGYTETTPRGQSVVGVPASGTVGATVGVPLTDQENRATGLHTHTASTSITDPGHTHTAGTSITPNPHGHNIGSSISPTSGGSGDVGLDTGGGNVTATSLTMSTTVNAATTGITMATTVNNGGTGTGTNAPTIQLIQCTRQ